MRPASPYVDGVYQVFHHGSQYEDADHTPVTADNVVVQHVVDKPDGFEDSVGSPSYLTQTVGTGTFTLYRDGHAITGTWKRDADADPTQFLDASGKPVPFRPGKTWVLLAPQTAELTAELTPRPPGPRRRAKAGHPVRCLTVGPASSAAIARAHDARAARTKEGARARTALAGRPLGRDRDGGRSLGVRRTTRPAGQQPAVGHRAEHPDERITDPDKFDAQPHHLVVVESVTDTDTDHHDHHDALDEAERLRPPAPTDPLTGGPVSKNPVVAVKIDNTGGAYPQFGIGSADIIYVEQVEGGLTRLIAIFHTTLPDEVGPARSVRTTDVQLLPSYGDPLLVFSGGKTAILNLLHDSPVTDTSTDSGYHRTSERNAPYNLIASLPEIVAQHPGKAAVKSNGMTFISSDPRVAAAPKVTKLTVTMIEGETSFDYVDGAYQVFHHGSQYRGRHRDTGHREQRAGAACRGCARRLRGRPGVAVLPHPDRRHRQVHPVPRRARHHRDLEAGRAQRSHPVPRRERQTGAVQAGQDLGGAGSPDCADEPGVTQRAVAPTAGGRR